MKKYILCLYLAGISLLCCSCGTKEKAPKLQDAVMSSEQKYTVERQSIGNTFCENGVVSGELSLLHFEKDGIIQDIHVNPGDKVKKGQVLATLDDTELEAELQTLRSNMEDAAQSLQDNLQILDYQIQKKRVNMEQLKKEEEQEKQIRLIEIEIEELQYEKSYMQEVYAIEREENESEEKRLAAELAKGIIKAPSDGTIVHVKGLWEDGTTRAGAGTEISVDETLLYFTNPDKKYVSTYWILSDEGIQDEDISSIKGYRADMVVDLQQKEYDSEIQDYFQKNEMGLNTRFEIMDETDWVEGDTVAFVVEYRHKENVLAVPNNAVHKDKEGEYVYCFGGGEKKKVYVETGIKTQTHTEITEGLEEGDVISYTEYVTPLEAITPIEGNAEILEVKVEKTDMESQYDEDVDFVSMDYEDVYKEIYTGDRGEFVRYAVKDGKKVKKGDIIAYIKEDVKNSELYQAEAELSNKENEIANAYKDYLSGQQELDKQIKESDNSYEKRSLQIDKYIAAREYQISHRADMEEKQVLSSAYNTLLEKKEGIPVYASNSGTIERASLEKGDILEKGEEIATITNKDFLYISLGGMSGTGSGVELQFEDKEAIRTNVWGLTAFSEYEANTYILIDGEKYTPGDELERMTYDTFTLKNVLAVPWEAVFHKWKSQGQWGYSIFYVFVKNGDELERRQVAAGSAGSEKYWIISGLEEGDTVVYIPDEEEVMEE